MGFKYTAKPRPSRQRLELCNSLSRVFYERANKCGANLSLPACNNGAGGSFLSLRGREKGGATHEGGGLSGGGTKLAPGA